MTWSGVDVPGANIRFDCISGIRLFDGSGTAGIPCGSFAYSSDLPTSGSVSITPINDTFFPITVTAHLIPSITAGSYDATREMVKTFTVAGAQVAQKPSGTRLTASAQTLLPGSPLTLSWGTQNAASANLIFACNTALSVTAGSTTLPCGTLAFSSPLPPTGTTTVTVANAQALTENLSIMLVPQDAAGSGYGVNAPSVSVSVAPLGSQAQVAPTNASATSATAPSANVASSAPRAPTMHAPFTKQMQRGSQNSQVSELQTFLAQDPAIYPEGFVTGYFGAATVRAVGRFQIRYGIATAGGSGYGIVGPKTRAKLNALQTP